MKMTSKEINQPFIEEPIKALNALFRLLYEGQEFTNSEYNFWLKLHQIVAEALEKLDQLKAIEKELEIDLLTLYKAFRYGIYVKKGKHNDYVAPQGLKGRLGWAYIQDFASKKNYSQPYEVKIIFGKSGICLSSLSYGKEWALTKEELEK